MKSTFALIALAALLATSQALASRVVERPGHHLTPAFVCIATTVRADGHTKKSSVYRGSGNARSDNFALRLARRIQFRPATGEEFQGLQAQERPGFMLFRVHSNDAFSFRLFEAYEDLPPICLSPYESVARDREINAATLDQR